MPRDISPIQKLRQSGISPERSLGQNFLVDANILDVIERMAGLDREDDVLEVGPGLGVLTGRLLDRCRVVHCIEVDPRLARHLEGEFAGREGFRLHLADAMKMDLGGLSPPPRKFVSNLPYNVATPLIMRSFRELPSVKLWCLMLQKEIADRLFAGTGSPNYGGPSVITRLMAEKVASRQVPGTVFYPRPRVKSSLLVFRRRESRSYTAARFDHVRTVVYGSFSHRRKTLVNSLADAEPGVVPCVLMPLPPAARKKVVAGLLESMGLPVNIRPQDLSPAQFEELASRLGGDGAD